MIKHELKTKGKYSKCNHKFRGTMSGKVYFFWEKCHCGHSGWSHMMDAGGCFDCKCSEMHEVAQYGVNEI